MLKTDEYLSVVATSPQSKPDGCLFSINAVHTYFLPSASTANGIGTDETVLQINRLPHYGEILLSLCPLQVVLLAAKSKRSFRLASQRHFGLCLAEMSSRTFSTSSFNHFK